ncbi:Polysaccharide pyruvyl transferase family protein WcaK [Cohaesibacter sp. ES.047]|uniref:polysaccharide pyruvyl transferase family protein n=1 Tax=Cohaesibacter sp. ES.047 TaxID=1798205 RepID=UPI000BB8E4C3|nr:polysaccharide pyruvyl transferase family protein [Cohaesibacter sp. ES.047]SNY94284.1 Polysaccharide pyruvyl transferase family protein WcaK [Cohaesibacter sp. ES.047]
MTSRLVHIGVHDAANKNAGDTLLYEVTRRAFEQALGPIEWLLHQQWQIFDEETAQKINADFDGIVIGGGGVFLRDQAGADIQNSGWQWNSTIAAVKAISVPIILYATGYNRFRGQEDFPPVFTSHINAVYEKAPFFSLRNTGSMRAIERYLDPCPNREVRRQFCPTTLIWQLYPRHRAMAEGYDSSGQRRLAVNAAFDRPHLRFGADQDLELDRLAEAMKKAQDQGWAILNVCHKDLDQQFEPHLKRAGVDFQRTDITNLSPGGIMAFYASVDAAIGMRGHAQLIPFGLRRPIFSIISHDKMAYFLQDIGHPEWGAEITDPALGDRILAFLSGLQKDPEDIRAKLASAQTACWQETERNFERIRSVL